ncbi:Uncharacterized SAM-binding protein YcdF, DUF218 family [Alkalispirochaeta americana]|uniref:Uncharacterized SAM-binding protein YcdF, DUF218 family n=1 Tax=Alkalispirochaeta americana TaxID=159291 RepID=A0A1N6QGM0_9SPIO|nr:ElyC/SanA/YdcF family protein [Alkalispirochaeta americana]SIQ15754.1 Uncharacterized SAM-binding protein YcdF, DUF218 family [Alkalispirochaeta americana]
MIFAAQKIIARLFFPVPLFFWISLAAWIALRGGRRRLARGLTAGAVVWLFLISWDPVGEFLLGTLENPFTTLEEIPADTDIVVVLGGGSHFREDRTGAARLSRSSQGRVLEGIRLVSGGRDDDRRPLLVFTGDSPRDGPAMAFVAGETARALGVPGEQVIMLEKTYNTRQEARAVRRFLEESSGWGNEAKGPNGRVVLVTSACHMLRSKALFQREGIDPVPAPAQYLTDQGSLSPWSFFPSASALEKTERFFYEVLGLLWMGMTR